jgi:hypothetical protein
VIVRRGTPPPDAFFRQGSPSKYRPIIDALIAIPGDWIAVDAHDVSGKNRKAKYGALNQAAAVETTRQHGRLYVRLAAAPLACLVVTQAATIDGGLEAAANRVADPGATTGGGQ